MNLSFILPYYKRFEAFKEAFEHNLAVFRTEGFDVVLVLDEPSESNLVRKLVDESGVRVKIIVNPNDHPWRPPCKAINVGLRHSGRNVCIISPETHIDLAFPGSLGIHDDFLRWQWLSGFMHYGRKRGEPFRHNHPEGFGMLMTATKNLAAIGGYDEAWVKYGGEDDDIRNRLTRHGIKRIISPQIRLSHYDEFDGVTRTKDHYRGGDHEPIVKNGENWGKDFQ